MVQNYMFRTHQASLLSYWHSLLVKGGMKRRLRVSAATAMSGGLWYVDSLHVFFHGFWAHLDDRIFHHSGNILSMDGGSLRLPALS